jgi:hypothetical protein
MAGQDLALDFADRCERPGCSVEAHQGKHPGRHHVPGAIDADTLDRLAARLRTAERLTPLFSRGALDSRRRHIFEEAERAGIPFQLLAARADAIA